MIDLDSYAVKMDSGPILQSNEDFSFFDLPKKIFMVADGFGGTGVGDKVNEIIQKNLLGYFEKSSEHHDKTLPYYFDPRYWIQTNILINACLLADKEVRKWNEGKNWSQAGGASACIGAFHHNKLSLVSVGNCLCYLARDGHSEVIQPPQIIGDFFYSPQLLANKTAPRAAYGLFNQLYFEVKEISLRPQDYLLVITDGVYAAVEPEAIRSVFSLPSPQLIDKVNYLSDLANRRGNVDNQALLLFKF